MRLLQAQRLRHVHHHYAAEAARRYKGAEIRRRVQRENGGDRGWIDVDNLAPGTVKKAYVLSNAREITTNGKTTYLPIYDVMFLGAEENTATAQLFLII